MKLKKFYGVISSSGRKRLYMKSEQRDKVMIEMAKHFHIGPV